MSYAEDAPRLSAIGYIPIPVRGKAPSIVEWQETTAADVPGLAKKHGASENTGVLCGTPLADGSSIVAVDIDVYDLETSKDLRVIAEKRTGKSLSLRVGLPPKWMTLYRTFDPDFVTKRKSSVYVDEKGRANAIEVLAKGQQFVAYGTHPDIKRPYQWAKRGSLEHSGIIDVPSLDLPLLPLGLYDDLCARLDAAAEAKGWKLRKRASSSNRAAAADSEPAKDDILDYLASLKTPRGWTLEKVEAMTSVLDADEYEQWVAVGMALHFEYSGSLDALALWNRWSATSPKYSGEKEVLKKWQSFK